MRKIYAIFALLVIIPSAYATDDTSHSQGGDPFVCSTSPAQQLECQIENILKFFFPQLIQQETYISNNMTQIIKNQQKEIANQNTEIALLQQLVDNTTPPKQQSSPTPHFTEPTLVAPCVKMTARGIVNC